MWIDGLGENLVRGEIVNQAEAALMRGLVDRRTFIGVVTVTEWLRAGWCGSFGG